MPSQVTLSGGPFTDAQGNPLANGSLTFELNQDEQIAGTAQIAKGKIVTINLDANGNIAAAQTIWGNDQMTPSNSYYIVRGFTSAGQLAWGPNFQQVTGASPFSVNGWVPNQLVNWNPPIQVPVLQTNEVNNGSQSLLDLHAGSNVTLTDNGSGRVTIAATGSSIPSTVGSVWMFGPGYFSNPFIPVPGQSPIASENPANSVQTHKFIIPIAITLSKCTIKWAGSAIAGSIAFAIYSADGNTKLIDTGGISKPAVTTNLGATASFSPVTLQPGTYWFAWSGTGTVQINGLLFTLPFTSDVQNEWIEASDGVSGTITNAVSSTSQLTLTLSSDPAGLGFVVGRPVFTGPLSNASFSTYQNKHFKIASLPGGNQVVMNVSGSAVGSAACSGTLQQCVIWRGIAANNSTGTPPTMPATLGTISDYITDINFQQYDCPFPMWSN